MKTEQTWIKNKAQFFISMVIYPWDL